MGHHQGMTMADLLKRAPAIGVLALVLLVSACTTSGSSGGRGHGSKGCTTTSSGSTPAGSTEHEVEELGITFLLPETFVPKPDDQDAFVATSTEPRAVFTITDLGSEMDQPQAREGETVEAWTNGCQDGFTLLDEAMDLPPGIAANGLVVNNGEQSFVVSMSSNEDDLGPAWDAFVASLTIA